MEQKKISKAVLKRLPGYLAYLKNMPEGASPNISATALANALDMGEVQVRKDLAAVSVAGKPKIGYLVSDLIRDLEHFLGYGTCSRAVLAGVGNLGLALMSYGGFADYGLDIVAAFDSKSALVGSAVDGVPVLPVERMADYCSSERIHIGILTVPASAAQGCADAMVRGGVKAIWNFAPVHLSAPPGVLVQRENMASSLALLSYHLKQAEEGLADEKN